MHMHTYQWWRKENWEREQGNNVYLFSVAMATAVSGNKQDIPPGSCQQGESLVDPAAVAMNLEDIWASAH